MRLSFNKTLKEEKMFLNQRAPKHRLEPGTLNRIYDNDTNK